MSPVPRGAPPPKVITFEVPKHALRSTRSCAAARILNNKARVSRAGLFYIQTKAFDAHNLYEITGFDGAIGREGIP